MKQITLTLSNLRGLHARAATKLVETAKLYESTVQICFEERTADGKSIMSLLMLAAGPGSQILLITNGKDAAAALQAIQTLIENKFHEGE
ncbi:MAG: HPr family phosphocarrier protein [Gammaproteobacteria bacterium]|nr:HPr family phosphocarrier protein [Gammaproteobacteria bacterium]